LHDVFDMTYIPEWHIEHSWEVLAWWQWYDVSLRAVVHNDSAFGIAYHHHHHMVVVDNHLLAADIVVVVVVQVVLTNTCWVVAAAAVVGAWEVEPHVDFEVPALPTPLCRQFLEYP